MVWIGGKVSWADPTDAPVFNVRIIPGITRTRTATEREIESPNIGHRSDREVA